MNGAELIAKEREEQIEKHGWTAVHDDAHRAGDLVHAAAWILAVFNSNLPQDIEWPREEDFARKILNHDHQERLAIAGALIAAEIDKLQREMPGQAKEE